MPTAPTKTLKDLFGFDQIKNPAGGLFPSPSTISASALFAKPSVVSPTGVFPPTAPAASGSLVGMSTPGGPKLVPVGGSRSVAHTVAPSSTSLFGPTGAAPIQPVVGATGPAGASGPAAQVPPQWLKPDGSFKTPDEVANDVGGVLASAHGNGDVGTLTLDQFGGNGKSEVALEADARKIGNARNDIAVGETDPYKVASQSGIAYTPAELAAIEKAYAGVYDPALDTALAKVDQKQKTDAAANQPFTLGKDEVRFDGKGNPLAVGLPSNPTGSGTYTRGSNPTVDAYVDGFKAGTYKASDIPDAYKGLVAQGVAQINSNAPLSKTSTDALSIIGQIEGDPGIGAISGVRGVLPTIPGSEPAHLTNLTKQLQATLSLANRQQLKGQGAISDFEFRVLGDAATDLGLDGHGHTNLNPDQFKAALGNLKLKLEVGPTTLKDDELQYLHSKGYSPEQIRAYDQQQSFGSVGNTSASKSSFNRPQRNNNPGNVKAGGLADGLAVGKDDQGHLIFPDSQTGFKALTADLTAKINGGSSRLPSNPTIAELGKVYAEDPNWPVKVAAILGVPVSTHTATVPLSSLVRAVATQEGFYA
jgi:hypothetical protein